MFQLQRTASKIMWTHAGSETDSEECKQENVSVRSDASQKKTGRGVRNVRNRSQPNE